MFHDIYIELKLQLYLSIPHPEFNILIRVGERVDLLHRGIWVKRKGKGVIRVGGGGNIA